VTDILVEREFFGEKQMIFLKEDRNKLRAHHLYSADLPVQSDVIHEFRADNTQDYGEKEIAVVIHLVTDQNVSCSCRLCDPHCFNSFSKRYVPVGLKDPRSLLEDRDISFTVKQPGRVQKTNTLLRGDLRNVSSGEKL
jgi:hypothetical protein